MIQVPRFNPGDDLSREFLDTLSRAITELQNRVSGYGSEDIVSDTIKIQNNSGDDRNAFDVLGIDGSYIDPTTSELEDSIFQFGEPVFIGVTPVSPDHDGKFAILTESIPNGYIGEARVTGVCKARVNIQEEGAQFAEIEHGNTFSLVSADSGIANIIWTSTSSTGIQWAIIRIGSGSSQNQIRTVKLKSVQGEYLDCVFYDVANQEEGEQVNVARSWHTRTSKVIGGAYGDFLEEEYTYISNVSRVAGIPSNPLIDPVTEVIWPMYDYSEPIIAVYMPGQTGVDGCDWMELNFRGWAIEDWSVQF